MANAVGGSRPSALLERERIVGCIIVEGRNCGVVEERIIGWGGQCLDKGRVIGRCGNLWCGN